MKPGALEKSVAVIVSSGAQGTGFFVSARFLLTAAHVVVKVAPNECVRVNFLGRVLEGTLIDKRTDQTGPWPFPDVALIQFAHDVVDVQPLPLTESIPPIGANVYSRGFPLSGEAGGQDAAAKVEGKSSPTADPQRFRVVLSAGQLQPGMSGAPAVLANGHVAGVITLTRDAKSALGGFFTPTSELVRAFGTAIAEFVVTDVDDDLPSKRPYVSVPPLPDNYVQRADAVANLRTALTANRTNRSIAMIAVQGMGGLGKTLLAQAICHDDAVREAFPDGIVWLPIGKEPARDVVTRLREAGKALHDDLAAYDNESGSKNQYKTVVRDKAALIVLDDVWSALDLEPFRAESPRSRVLFTTRDASIAETNAAAVIAPDFLDAGSARDLLAKWSGLAASEMPAIADDLVRACGGLPLALATIGAMLRGKPLAFWQHVNKLVRKADLAKLRQQFPDYPHPNLLAALQISVDSLDPKTKARERYFALAVMTHGTPIHPLIQRVLWNSDEDDALETAEEFVGLALAQRTADGAGIRLHDLLLDYVQGQYPDRKALDVIHAATRLSSHVIERDPRQFASQLVGRLLPQMNIPAVRDFIEAVATAAPTPWLRPVIPALEAPGTGLLRTLEGHEGWVSAVAVTPDGRRAVSGSYDKNVIVWELDSGRALQILKGHTFDVLAVAVTSDGRRAVSGSADQTLKVWDLDSGRVLHNLTDRTELMPDNQCAVRSVAITPDDRCAVCASAQGITVWDLASGRVLQTMKAHAGGTEAVAVMPDGRRAVDSTLVVWDLASGQALQTLEHRAFRVKAVAVTPDGRRAVFGGSPFRISSYVGGSPADHETLGVWDLESGRAAQILEGHVETVNAVAVSPDGRSVVSGSSDKSIRVWDIESGRALQTFEGHTAGVTAVAVTPDGRCAVSGAFSGDTTLKVWDLASGRTLKTRERHASVITAVAVTPDGRRAVSRSDDHTLKIWDVESGRTLQTIEEDREFSDKVVALTPDARHAISISKYSTLTVWNLENGVPLQRLEGTTERVTAMAVTPDSRRAVSSSNDNTLKFWDIESGRAEQTVHAAQSLSAVALTADGRRALCGDRKGNLELRNLASGRPSQNLEGHTAPVVSVAITTDGRRAVSGSWDTTLRVWDLDTGHTLRTLTGHARAVLTVALTPDGRRAVSGSSDNTVKIWDLESGAVIATFWCDAAARCCAISCESTIVAGDEGGRLYTLTLQE